MPDLPMPPDMVDMGSQVEALRAVSMVCAQRNLRTSDLCRRAGVSSNSLFFWRSGRRPPKLSKFIRLAGVVGYEVVLVSDNGSATDMRDLTACIEAIDVVRQRRGISLAELEFRSGMSVSSFFAWKYRHRDPAIPNIVALAQALGFSVVMRRVPQ